MARFTNPNGETRAALTCVIAVVRRATHEELGALPLESVFIADSERGFVDLVTNPPSQVILDGVLLPGTTPFWRLPVGPSLT